MSEWTWLFRLYPLADIELMGPPVDVKSANVLVRTARVTQDEETGETLVTVRVAPHNTAPFRGGPWVHTFREQELLKPGEAIVQFREALWEQVRACQKPDGR